jgi:hypothetical protein
VKQRASRDEDVEKKEVVHKWPSERPRGREA